MHLIHMCVYYINEDIIYSWVITQQSWGSKQYVKWGQRYYKGRVGAQPCLQSYMVKCEIAATGQGDQSRGVFSFPLCL